MNIPAESDESRERRTWISNNPAKAAALTRTNSELCLAFQRGDRDALQRLIVQNEPMIRRIAHGYVRFGFTPDELVHEGRCGYMKGVMRYREDGGANVNTYATWWMKATILQYISQEMKRRRRFFSYDHLTDRSSGQCSMAFDLENPEDRRRPDEELLLLFQQEADRLRKRIRTLLSRHQSFVLCRRYGFDDLEGPCTLQEIGDVLGVTRECVRQICNRALDRLRVTDEYMFQMAEGLCSLPSNG